jgi:calcineurin-like phosphoesterase family protein
VFGKRVVFTHEPLDRVDPWDVNIHGHLHRGVHRGDVISDGRHILISVEHLQYQPIPLHTVIELGATPVYMDGRFRTLDPDTAQAPLSCPE